MANEIKEGMFIRVLKGSPHPRFNYQWGQILHSYQSPIDNRWYVWIQFNNQDMMFYSIDEANAEVTWQLGPADCIF